MPATLCLLASAAGAAIGDSTFGSQQPPKPTLVFGTTIRIAEAFAGDPLAGAAGDGCLAAEEKLRSGGSAIALSKVAFDAKNKRIRQSNSQLQRVITENVTNIGKWDLPIPQEWDLTTVDGKVSCATEPLPPALCPNGTLPPSCPPQFGSWGALNPFTNIVGMWYPNTSKLDGSSTPTADTYNFMDVRRTLLPNEGCGTSNCTMQHCSRCNQHEGHACTACPCKNCIMELNVTRNYTYTVAKKAQPDGSHQMVRYQWTQGIPETKSGATPGIGRDCFIFDWSQDWTSNVQDSDFAPPPGVKCALSPTPAPPTPWVPSDECAKEGFPCTAGASVCCIDPNSKGKGTGACYKVHSCSQLPGGGAKLRVQF